MVKNVSSLDISSKLILLFGVYIICVGIALIFIPNQLLNLFGLPKTHEVWIRIGGLLTTVLGFYYIQSVRYKLVIFYKATVWGRLGFAFGIAFFVSLGLCSAKLLIVSFIDIFFAGLTYFSLKKSKTPKAI